MQKTLRCECGLLALLERTVESDGVRGFHADAPAAAAAPAGDCQPPPVTTGGDRR